MRAIDLYNAWQNGQVSKRIYRQIMGEKLSSLFEIQDLVKNNKLVESVMITPNGTILTTDGIKLFFDFDQPMCRAESILIDTEREGFSFLNLIINSVSCSDNCRNIFDIGANAGRVSLMFAKYADKKTNNRMIYSFEPVTDTYKLLQKNLSINDDLKKMISPFNIGFYSKAEDLKFFIPAGNEAASIKPINDEFYTRTLSGSEFVRKEVKEQICKVTTLDLFVSENNINHIEFIKVDTEGAEFFVFKGGEKTISLMKPVIYTEMLRKHSARFGYHPNDIIGFFENLGYGCYTETDGKLMRFYTMDENTIETNFFFLHDEKHKNLIKSFSETMQ